MTNKNLPHLTVGALQNMVTLKRLLPPMGMSLILGIAIAASGSQADARSFQQQSTGPVEARESGVVSQLRQCQTISQSEARLSCFDRNMAAFDAASRSGEVAVLDRRQVEQTNRQLFGFQVPNLGQLFGSNDISTGPAIDEIETTLVKAQRRSDGRWLFHLADGSVWHQTNNDRFAVRDREGDPVKIRRASFNSYLMTVGGSRGIRVQRQ